LQSLQSKQDSLLQRVDELDQENEELKNDVADLEDAKETLEDNLSRAMKEKKTMEIKVKESEVRHVQYTHCLRHPMLAMASW
jgi:predicted  nucleic acid-binding Zn-ribbon protein